jgi:hypothetical protein
MEHYLIIKKNLINLVPTLKIDFKFYLLLVIGRLLRCFGVLRHFWAIFSRDQGDPSQHHQMPFLNRQQMDFLAKMQKKNIFEHARIIQLRGENAQHFIHRANQINK